MEFQVEVVEPLGDGVIVHGTVSGTLVTAPSGDDEVLPRLAGERAEITTKFEPTLRPSPGERMRLAIAPHHVHVFDGRTGDVIVAAGA
jgi:ABC-type sugar transport system ATPase subunit